MGGQASIPLVLMRGGTSKGLYFHDRDLPPVGPVRDALLSRLMGSPDILQIDGLGGSRPITSKVAIVGPSAREDADVDYTFAQVDIESRQVSYNGNCGNISSGVGPFAIDEGLVPAHDGVTTVRIHNTNTGKILTAAVPVSGGVAEVEGDLAIPGVPGTGAEIVMDWSATVGAMTGRLLPTGAAVDKITLEDGRTVPASIVDAGNPVIWLHSGDFGLDASARSEINEDHRFLGLVRETRGKACVMMGLCDDWRSCEATVPAVPIIGFVAPPVEYRTLNGRQVDAAEMDLRLHLMFMNRLHESVAGTASISLAAASRIPGTTVSEVTRDRGSHEVLIGHPSGVTTVSVVARDVAKGSDAGFRLLGISRTARRLMAGHAFYPAELAMEGR
ncbi:2-methylaconitate cis-trans isomerase PrpF family protein [Amycolatopsis sp. EV170708-02-1]|uniref:2-methylaconitate cis-trans isomerase PrpF family protein n=1 Tax=Amycolatopsis sp. EV170708-02-1 TaxID=2919322 RepID=UPI001F0BD34A|nr:PrpF domain-containing protein [Amycolatopsis sp. EV170708-02-1]UMP00064.1 PrpF protein [Amycolatopsis sp. EV170708-02-1]